jgi:hypothetical protein
MARNTSLATAIYLPYTSVIPVVHLSQTSPESGFRVPAAKLVTNRRSGRLPNGLCCAYRDRASRPALADDGQSPAGAVASGVR